MVRRRIVIGNWKMYKTIPETVEFVKTVAPQVAKSQAEVYLAVPFTAIQAAAQEAETTRLVVGAQNMNDSSEGAFTGEIAGRMLVDAGARFVVLGHSERRHIFGESDEFIQAKIQRALTDGLEPVVCIGETLEQRQNDETQTVVKQQLLHALDGLQPADIQRLIIAYEPVWAIGTSHCATCVEAQDAQSYCREVVAETWGKETADVVEILYGGSVNPENAPALWEQEDVDGLLVGGCSLNPEHFINIVNGN